MHTRAKRRWEKRRRAKQYVCADSTECSKKTIEWLRRNMPDAVCTCDGGCAEKVKEELRIANEN